MDRQLEALDLNLLLALHWLLTERNVTSAAGRLGMSQPATSRALGRLRDLFDDPLLIKSGRTMVPTPRAEQLAPLVANAVDSMRDVLRISSSFDPSTGRGRFSLACKDYVGDRIARSWATHIQPDAPQLQLDIVDANYGIIQDLIAGKVDMVIVPDLALSNVPVGVDLDQFVHKIIYADHFVGAMRAGHPLAGQEIDLETYRRLPHAMANPERGTKSFVDDYFYAIGKGRQVAFRTQTFMVLLSILKQTDCVALAPSSLFEGWEDQFYLFKPPIELPAYRVGAAWHPNWTHDPRHQWVRERLFRGFTTVADSPPVSADGEACC